jgi:hypothetical protein
MPLDFRAAVRFHMAQKSILGQLLLLIRHVNQEIEAGTFRVPFDDRQKLLLMQD